MEVKEQKINMVLKCKINGIEYEGKLVQGNTFSEEYNETLDSASIFLSQIPKMEINPYDDVYIYNENYEGYTTKNKKLKCKFNLNTIVNTNNLVIYFEEKDITILKNKNL